MILPFNSDRNIESSHLQSECSDMKSLLHSLSGIARCFTFGGSRHQVLHDPSIPPRSDLSKDQYMKKNEQTTINHFHEKLLKLKDLMKTKVKT